MDSSLGKVLGNIAYVGSKASKGVIDIAKGANGLIKDFAKGTGDFDQILPEYEEATGKGFKNLEEATQYGLTKGDVGRIEDNGMVGKAMQNVGGVAEFAPTGAISKAMRIPQFATFFLQSLGAAKDETEKLREAGTPLDPKVEKAYEYANGAIGGLLFGELGNSIFGKMPSGLRKDVISALSADIIKQGVEKNLTGAEIQSLLKEGINSLGTKSAQALYKMAESGTHAMKTLGTLNIGSYAIKEGADALNSKEVFNQKLGDLTDNLMHTVGTAAMFGAAGGMGSLSKLSKYSSYKNAVVESLMKDTRPENLVKVKEDVAEIGRGQGWSDKEIEDTTNQVDNIGNITSKLKAAEDAVGKKIPSTKLVDAVDLVNGRTELQEQLKTVQEGAKNVDESVKGIKNPNEQFLVDKIDQANDKLSDLITGKKTKYIYDKEADKYFKEKDGERKTIEKSRYELEEKEKPYVDEARYEAEEIVEPKPTEKSSDSIAIPEPPEDYNIVSDIREKATKDRVPVKTGKDVVEGEVVELLDGRKATVDNIDKNKITMTLEDGTELSADPSMVEIFKQKANEATESSKAVPKAEEASTETGEEVIKPKYTIKGDKVTPKVEENVNTPNEPVVGGETKADAEVVQPTSNDKGGNGTQTERVTEETIKPSFDELATRSLEGDVVKNTLSNVERETNTKLDKTISEYNAADFKSAFVQGEQTVQAAKEEFGKDYVSKFTDYVKESKMPFENKAVMLVSLENDLRKQYLENPTPQLKKQVDLATKNSIEFLRSSARATGVGIFRQAARANYETEAAAEAIFSPKERQERTKVEEAVQSTSEDVQKEYEARQETQTDAVVQEAIDKGVQARIDDIYEALPSSRKQAADKAISALERIQKKLRLRTYDASIGIPVAIIDAGITTIKQAIKAGVKVADAIELGINKIKEKYSKEWKNEDKFRKDMLEGFSDENIDVQDGTRTSKTSDKLKQELIDAGYGKEITVTTKNGKEKRNIIDWKKLTGIEGSFDRMKENLEESLKKKGYSEAEINEFQKQLEDEYNDIHADIIQKSLNELNRRNTPREATAKTLARRLAELYNLGLYDRDVDTYSNILNNALGISPKSQAAFNEIRDFNRSLAQLLDSRGVNGKRLTDLEIITAENEIKAHIQKVIQKVQFAEGNGFFKFSDVMKNIFSAMQRMMLAKISQLIENPFSGALNDTQVKLQDAFSKGKWDTKELRENRAMLGRAIYEDASLRGGDEYGGVGNPFTTKNSIESFVNGLSKNAMYQAFVGMLSGRQYLDATDSYFKIKRTEKEFTNNLLRILTDKTNPNGAMDQNDALRFVSEALTGQSFNQAKETARGIITSINDKAGKEIIRPAETNVTRIANDLVKDNLVLGGKMNMSEVESAFKAAYKTAGKSIGHESNNLLTDVVNATNQTIQRKLDEALKKKDWSTAAVLNLTSILSKNIVNPFVGGGTNWTVIGLQKMGLPTEWIRSDVGFSKKPIDLGTKEGLKELKDNLSANATRQRQFGRIMTGTLTALAAIMAVRYSGDEEEYKKWLKKHPDTRKLINKIQPVPLTLYLARDNKNNEFIKSIASTLGSRYNAQTDGDKLFQAVSDFWDGYKKGNEKKTKKAWGTVGQLMGRRINVPYVSSISNYGDMGNKLYKEFVGKPVKDPYKSPKGFVDGYFKGGLMDYLNITPQDLKDDKK